MGYVVLAITKNSITGKEYNPPGSDYTVICKDLKTIRGVKNRIKKYKWRENTIKLIIVSYQEWENCFNQKIICTIEEFERMSF